MRLSLDALEGWLGRAHPGSSAIYHIGLLTADRMSYFAGKKSIFPADDRALTAWEEYAKGKAVLTQARVAPGTFWYIITKTKG